MPIDNWVLLLIILVALGFDFLNGFHDAANSIATVVSTRVLSPQKAVVWAAFFNFVAAFVLGTHVAKTLGRGMIDLTVVTQEVVLAGLIGAILWNLITWYYGIPVSSSHALIGGYAGAAIAKAGWSAIIASGWTKTLVFIVLAPLIGMVLALRADDAGDLDVPALEPVPARQAVPAPAAAVGRALQPRPRRQRRTEDDGHHHRPAGRLGPPAEVRCPALGHPDLPRGDRARHDVRRLADRQDDGHEDHEAPAVRRLLRRDLGRHHPGRGDAVWASRSRPPTRSPARSWASARRSGCPR